MNKIPVLSVIGLLMSIFVAPPAGAGIITSQIGNTSPGIADGDTPGVLTVTAAQSGQPSPFDAGLGQELFGPDAAGSWQHSFGVITDPILSATMTLGIFDHDSAASGDQVALFSLDGTAFTTALNAVFNGRGGGDNEYNEYEIALDSSLFAGLLDGLLDVELNLAGPGQQTDVFSGAVTETSNNGAHYIFSSLEIITDTGGPPQPMPEPGVILLMLTALGLSTLCKKTGPGSIPEN